MFSKEMEALIEATLTDGVLTDQEKTALVKRAEKEGIDLNELEIYIQSILQKRQQELDKKSREARAQQEEADSESEKLCAQTLRKCPKCGALIPNLTNVCPECGFIIEKTVTDKKVVVLLSLLNELLKDVYIDSSHHHPTVGYEWHNIKKEQYEDSPNMYNLRDVKCDIDGYVIVEYNYQGILTEASMYKDNEDINSLIKKIHDKERNLLLEKIQGRIEGAHELLDPNDADYGDQTTIENVIDDLDGCLKTLIELYPSEEYISRAKGELATIETKYKELLKDPEYQKIAKKIYDEIWNSDSEETNEKSSDSRVQALSVSNNVSNVSGLDRIISAIILLVLVFSGWFIILLFFSKGREFLSNTYKKVVG